jgi:16S rRNA (guanine(527)-N(7))-methyltransferase RsmG
VFAELLRKRISPIAELSPTQVNQLEHHYNLLIKWNKVLNLTSLRKVEEIVERHYCESIFLGMHLPLGPLSIGDVGSGAGFPGVPVAIARSECKVSLIESHQRKCVFLREATRGIKNVHVLAERVENVNARFDWAVCRAIRFSEIEIPVSAISAQVAILGTERPPDSRFTWNVPTQLPWGHQRYLWLGTRRST